MQALHVTGQAGQGSLVLIKCAMVDRPLSDAVGRDKEGTYSTHFGSALRVDQVLIINPELKCAALSTE